MNFQRTPARQVAIYATFLVWAFLLVIQAVVVLVACPAVVIMDINRSKMNGVEATAAIAEAEQHAAREALAD